MNARNLMSRSEKIQDTKRQRRESAERLAKAQAGARAVVASGKCPDCGETLRRNLSMAGWWQCAQFGAEGFRKDSAKAACNWQGFTE